MHQTVETIVASVNLAITMLVAASAVGAEVDCPKMLDGCASVWTEPLDRGVISQHMTRGPILGNGALGATATCDSHKLTFFLANNGFITDAHRPGPIRIGGITLSIRCSAEDVPFRMVQDIGKAELRCDLAGKLTARSLVAATRNALVLELHNGGATPLALRVDTWSPGERAEYPATAGVKHGLPFSTRETCSRGDITHERPDRWVGGTIRREQVIGPARWVCKAAIATRVLGIPSNVSTDTASTTASAAFQLAPNQTTWIITQCEISIKESPLEGTLQAVASDTPALLKHLCESHLAWWKHFWGESEVVLNDPLLDRYYHTAMYAMGCANRAGRAAPGLYGCWITTDSPAWASNIHLNYNGEAPYFGVYSSNRAALADPFNRAMLAFIPEGHRRAAEDMALIHPSVKDKKCRGILFPVGICSCLGVAGCNRYVSQVYDASYAGMQFIEQYEYTLDDTFLREQAYPFIRECGDFWESYLDETVVDGKKQYIFSAGTREKLWGKTPSTDLAFIHRIFRFLISSSKTLQVDAVRRSRWQDILDHLPPYPVGLKGGKSVILWDADGRYGTGENCFGIDCIYPGNAVNQNRDADPLLALARDTALQYSAWTQRNNMPRLFLARLRVGADPAAVRQAFRSTVAHSISENGMLNDSMHGMEKCGGIEVTNRLLLSSDENTLRFFEGWDQSVPAVFRNLRAKGAFLVSAEMNNGTVGGVRILSEKGRECVVVNPWRESKIRVVRNGNAAETMEGDRITLKTSPGETLELQRE